MLLVLCNSIMANKVTVGKHIHGIIRLNKVAKKNNDDGGRVEEVEAEVEKKTAAYVLMSAC